MKFPDIGIISAAVKKKRKLIQGFHVTQIS